MAVFDEAWVARVQSASIFSQIRTRSLPRRLLQWRRRVGSRPPPMGRRPENTYREKSLKEICPVGSKCAKTLTGKIFRRSRRRSRRQGLAQALRRRAGGSVTPAVAGEAGARLIEETARKGGQKRERSAALSNDTSSVRTMIDVYII